MKTHPLLLCLLLLLGAVSSNGAEDIAELKKKADQGDAVAQHNLGLRYHIGDGVPQDSKEAFKWFKKAADQGDALNQYVLGMLIYMGEGMGEGGPPDYKEAIKWLRKAADQGYGDSQTMVGLMYENGQGVPENLVEAFKWLTLAAANGEKVATESRDDLSKKMTPEQIAEAQRLASEFVAKKKAKPDTADAQPKKIPTLLSLR